MAATYKQFLASPSPALLADKASLHYITTTTSFAGSAEVIKHFTGLSKHVQKKKEDVLNIVEGDNGVVFEIDTGLEFQISGGPYLPNLDDNFLTDRVVYLPITHFVALDADGKISQIRLQWDQGSLLKQIEIIGRTGRNWPIRDSRDQLALIQSCLKSSGHAHAAPGQNHNDVVIRTRGSSSNVLRDPHATLHKGFSREEMDEPEPSSVISPYAGKNRPRQRGFTEILGDEPEDDGSPTANRQSMISPHKAGANKNFQPMRLFDGQQEHHEDEETPKGNGKVYRKPDPSKYSHFDFADGSDPQDHPEAGVPLEDKPKSKHDSQWSFQDFVTPSKPVPSRGTRAQDVRHWDTEDSATSDASSIEPLGKGRRDAETHFELQDDGERVVHNDRNGSRARGSTQNENMGLYKNKLFDNEGGGQDSERALSNITNLKGRNQTFDPHFDMVDESPVPTQRKQDIPEARKKAVKMMDANWSAYDESPKPAKMNRPQGNGTAEANTGINIAGNGMGGRKGTGADFLYGGDVEESTGINIKGNGMGSKKGTGSDFLYSTDVDAEPPKPQKSYRPQGNGTEEAKTGINIAGNGMGGKKGTGNDFLYSTDVDDEPIQPQKNYKPQGNGTEEAKTGITIAGNGMGGKKGTGNDFLYGGDSEESTGINIKGDGMGGKKGTNRDWLYGEEDVPKPPAPKSGGLTQKQRDFWDF